VQNNLSELFEISKGLGQGDAMSCILFNLALENVVSNSGIEANGIIHNKNPDICI
jgi:hypothetical protein